MSALEWLDAVRADLDAADLPWAETWSEYGSTVHTTDGYTVAWVGKAEDAELIASAPDRLDRMERALRGVVERHRPIEVEPSDTICAACSNQLPNGRFLPAIEWPCPDVDVILEVLG